MSEQKSCCSGESAKLKPTRERKSRITKEERAQNAKDREILKNEEDFILNLQLHWSFLDTRGRGDSALADGILMGLLNFWIF